MQIPPGAHDNFPGRKENHRASADLPKATQTILRHDGDKITTRLGIIVSRNWITLRSFIISPKQGRNVKRQLILLNDQV